MSIKLNKILPPANELFSEEELEKIFLHAIKLTPKVDEEFTSVIIDKDLLYEHHVENEYLINLFLEINTDEIVKKITMHFSESLSSPVVSKNIETSVTFAESEIPHIEKYNLEGAA